MLLYYYSLLLYEKSLSFLSDDQPFYMLKLYCDSLTALTVCISLTCRLDRACLVAIQ